MKKKKEKKERRWKAKRREGGRRETEKEEEGEYKKRAIFLPCVPFTIYFFKNSLNKLNMFNKE